MSILWFTLRRWSSGAPFQQPFAPKASQNLNSSDDETKLWRQRGVQNHRKIRFWALQLVPSLPLILTPSINQLSKGADWERFTVAQWQLCCSEPTNHPGSFVSCLKVPLRALLCVVLLALPVGTRRICFTLCLSLAGNGIHCWAKGMPQSCGCSRVIYKQHSTSIMSSTAWTSVVSLWM